VGYRGSECSKSRTMSCVSSRDRCIRRCIGLSDADGSKPIWGTSANNRRAKYYELTKSGDKQIEVEKGAWETLTLAVAQVLEAV
jgi:hypothetical protein